jgi:acyl-CoA dehydrogenase
MLYENYESPWLDDELRMLQDAARKFFETEFKPHNDRWITQGKVDRDAWNKAGAAGLLVRRDTGRVRRRRRRLPPRDGDHGRNAPCRRQRVRQPGAQHHRRALHPALRHRSAAQRWLPKMATGELVGAIAMTEPNTGSDLQAVRTTAIRDGDEYVINGSKTYITNGQHADLVIVVAKTDPTKGAKGISLIVVETASSPGFERGRNLKKLGQRRPTPRSCSSRTAACPSPTCSATTKARASFSSCSSCPRSASASPRRRSSRP